MMEKVTLKDWMNQIFLEWQLDQGERKTIREFAEYLSIRDNYLSMIMNGKRETIGQETADKIAVYYPQIYESGKGKKDRIVFLGNKGMRELLRYLRFRPGELKENDPLWISTTGDTAGRRLKQAGLREILRRRSTYAHIDEISPHDFRRAFCLQYLRNGGDIFTLKYLMGHESLDMLLRYLALANADLETAHRKASPADNL